MGGRGAVLHQAVTFSRVLFGGAAISFLAAVLDNGLRVAGDARTPALSAGASLFLQAVLTPLFMFAAWGLTGAAVATLVAQFCTVPARLYLLGRRSAVVRIDLGSFPVGTAIFKELLRVALPSSLSTFSNYVALFLLTTVVARFGTAHLAAYGLGTRLDFLLLSLTYGVAVAVLTLVGVAVGARDWHLARSYVKRAAAWAAGSLALAGAILFPWPELWLQRFTRDAAVVAVGRSYFAGIAPSYPFMAASTVFAFAFQGTGRAVVPLVWTLLRVTLVVGASLIAVHSFHFADSAIFACVAIGNCVSALILGGLFWRHLGRMEEPPPTQKNPDASTALSLTISRPLR